MAARPTSSNDENQERLIPEWRVAADDQVVWVGVAVFVVIAILFGWNRWRTGDESADPISGPLSSLASGVSPDAASEPNPGVPRAVGVAGGSDGTTNATEVAAPEVAAPETTATVVQTTAAPTTAEVASTIGDVQAAVQPLAGAIVGTNDGSKAVLQGFVANAGERDEAEEVARAVEGIVTVDNRLQLLEPAVTAATGNAGVVEATASGVGTVLTVGGALPSEDDRAGALRAASEVEGVTEVIDELTVVVVADLNALPQVQFATSSDRILPESFAVLDAAAELITATDGVRLRVEGYTDIIGPASANLRLSANRATAVRDYLIDSGVDPSALDAEGFGETQEFGEGNADEALAANRLVRFVEIS